MKTWAALGLSLGLLAASPADAELIRITPVGAPAAGYEESGADVGPVFIGSDGFRLTYHGGGDTTLLNPILLIFGIPDTDPGSYPATPTLTVTNSDPSISATAYSDTTAYGATWGADGFAGTFDSTAGNKSVYEVVNLVQPKGSDSQNYTNWNGATGLTSWDLFVFAIVLSPEMQRGDWVEFSTLPGGLPAGSYVVGYGCTQYATGGSADDPLCKDSKGNNSSGESTPFTFAGLVKVPEPGALTLLIPAVGLLLARRRKHPAA